MNTLYIDIYFLINFTVDIIALDLASRLTRVNTKSRTLIFSSATAALYACFVALTDKNAIVYFISVILTSVLITLMVALGESFQRKLKFFSAFIIFETLLGGSVTFAFGLLDRYFYPLLIDTSFAPENRNILVLSLLILLSYGIIKMLLLLFEGSDSERSAELTVSVLGYKRTLSALIDTGNLLVDPLDSRPVIIIKKNALKISELNCDILSSNNEKISKNIRLIPASGIGGKTVMIGLRTDYIYFPELNKKIEGLTIALDNEEGTYGGYYAIIPASVVNNLK